MYPYKRVPSKRFQSTLDEQMSDRIPSHSIHLYHAVQEELVDDHIVQQGQDVGFLPDAGSSYAYSIPQEQVLATTAGSNQIEPTFQGFGRNPVDFPAATNPCFDSNRIFRNDPRSFNPVVYPSGLDTFSPAAIESGSSIPILLQGNDYSPEEIDNLSSCPAFHDHLTPFANLPFGYSGFEDMGHIGINEQGFLAAADEMSLSTNLVPSTTLLNDCGGNFMGKDDMLNLIPRWHHRTDDVNLPLIVPMSPRFQNGPSSDVTVASSSIDYRYQSNTNKSLRIQGQATTTVPHFFVSDTVSSEITSAPHSTLLTERGTALQGVVPNTSKDMPNPHRIRRIKAMPATRSNSELIDDNMKKIVGKPPRKRGRQGPLGLEQRKRIAGVRKKKACIFCSLRKVTCSTNDICDVCSSHSSSPFMGKFCHRSRLQDYAAIFLPYVLMKHLHRDSVETLTDSLQFKEKKLLLSVWTGRTPSPITVFVNEFVPPNKEFSRISDLNNSSNDCTQTFSTMQSLDYGMHNHNPDEIVQKCRVHVEASSKLENIVGDDSKFDCKLLRAICRFLKADSVAQQDDTLHCAVMMNRCHHIMGRRIVFNDDLEVDALTNPEYPSDPHPLPAKSARVLSRQIKAFMYLLLEDLTRRVLVGLDYLLKEKKSGWEMTFVCTFLILCLCGEELQSAMDGFALFRLAGRATGLGQDTQSESEACEILEKEPLDHLWVILSAIHMKIMKMHSHSDQNTAAATLMKELHEIRTEHDSEINRLAAQRYSGGSSQLTMDHKTFRERNHGRLIAMALRALPNFGH